MENEHEPITRKSDDHDAEQQKAAKHSSRYSDNASPGASVSDDRRRKKGEICEARRKGERKRKKDGNERQEKKRKRRKRTYSSDSSSDSFSDSNSTDSSYHKRRKHRKKQKKKKRSRRHKKKHLEDDPKSEERHSQKNDPAEVGLEAKEINNTAPKEVSDNNSTVLDQNELEPDATKRRVMVPMTKEQYEAEQSKVRQVYDPESGRYRLVRGSGEIIESIVSREDHLRINQQATRGDGASFSRSTMYAARRSS